MRIGIPSLNLIPPTHDTEASFLGIPGELRNQIYRHLLLCPEGVLVTPEEHIQPNILMINRKIRKEAKGIFQQENEFYIEVFNLRPYYPQPSHWAARLNYIMWFCSDGTGIRSGNLQKWLELAFKHPEVPRLVHFVGELDDSSSLKAIVEVVMRLFEMLALLEAMKEKLSFELTSKMVQSAMLAWRDDVSSGPGINWKYQGAEW